MRTRLMTLCTVALLGGCAAAPKENTQATVEPALVGRSYTVINDQARPAPAPVSDSLSTALNQAGCVPGGSSEVELLVVCRAAPATHGEAPPGTGDIVRVTSVWPGDIPVPAEWRVQHDHPWSAIVEVRVADVGSSAPVEEIHIRVAARAPEETALRRDGLHALWRVLDMWAAGPPHASPRDRGSQ
jgi:hypothetical protein